MRPRYAIIAAVLIGATAAVSASAGWLSGVAPTQQKAEPAWTEIAWPFPIDEWGMGKAYRCAAADCGSDVEIYLRGKLGFCNCTTGVADDAELDRLGDFQLLGGRATPRGQGRPIRVAWMKGRDRAYALPGLFSHKVMLAIAFSNECDALVATAVMGQGALADAEPRVLAFLNSVTVERWAKAELGR